MKGDKVFSWITVALAVIFLIGSFTIVPSSELTITSPGGYPMLIAVFCVVFGVLSMWEGRRKGDTEKKLDDGEGFRVFDPVIVAFLIMLTLYVVAIIYLHYAIATLVFLFAAIFYLKKGDWRQAILISYISTFTIMLIFKYLFSVIMP